jgi:tRNA(Arg) A34 adenosine deaminase TadA
MTNAKLEQRRNDQARMTEIEAMQYAIEKAHDGIESGQSPFGAVIVRGDDEIVAAHNTVWRDCDPSAHAEVNAIRATSAALKTIDLSGRTMFSTCEPCPMCLAAIHWARIDRVVFGATIADAEAAGFTELRVSAVDLARLGGSRLRVEPGPCRDECCKLFEEWKHIGLSRPY